MKDQNDSGRKLEEQTFHDRYFKGDPLRTAQAPFYNERVRQMLLSSAFSELSEMDGEALSFKDGTFDLIFGRAFFHHLDTGRAGKELARALTPNGKAVFIEPLGSNPIIKLYRFLTPASRTSDEHPLIPEDFRQLEEHFYCLRQKPFFCSHLHRFSSRWSSKVKCSITFSFRLYADAIPLLLTISHLSESTVGQR